MRFGEFERDRLLAQVGEGAQHRDRTLQLTNVVSDTVCDPLRHVVRERDALTLGLRSKDGDPRLEVRLIDLVTKPWRRRLRKRS